MERVSLLIKENIVNEIRLRFESYNNAIFVSFNKLKAFPLNILRNKIREKDGNFFVAKNTLVERFFLSLNKDIKEFLKDEIGIVFTKDRNIVEISKILFDFAKENQDFKIQGGILVDKIVNTSELESLSKLPPKEVILVEVLSTILSPITGFLALLRQPLLDCVLVLDDIKKRKEEKS